MGPKVQSYIGLVWWNWMEVENNPETKMEKLGFLPPRALFQGRDFFRKSDRVRTPMGVRDKRDHVWTGFWMPNI